MLGKSEILRLIKEQNLISGYLDLESQLQTNSFDLTLASISKFTGIGEIMKDSKKLTPSEKLHMYGSHDERYYLLHQGTYLITFNETIKLPKGIAMLNMQRSSLMRCGVTTSIGLWDQGYDGQGCANLVVGCDIFKIQKDARIVNAVFFPVEGDGSLYAGTYQKERMSDG